MRKAIMLLLFIGLFIAGTVGQAQALSITMGEYRFVVAEAYTQLVDPGYPGVAAEAFQGNQWAVARINEIQKKNTSGLYDVIWSPGNVVPDPPTGTTDTYINAVFGGLTLQPDPRPGVLGVMPSPNTGLTYNLRQHSVAPATVPVNPTGTGMSHPDDYVTNAEGFETFPYAAYFIDDTVHTTGPGYLKLYSTATDVFNTDVAAGIGASGGAFGSFAPNTIAGTLLLDTIFDPAALLAQDTSGDSVDSTGGMGQLRALSPSDTESGINAYFQTTAPLGIDPHGDGYGTWDILMNSNSPTYFGADGDLDFTARAMIGSPYLAPGLGQDVDPVTAFGWDFRDVGQARTTNPIPEPATLLLVGSGLLGLAGYGRKKRFRK